jgi:diguanylate cyclase (GGDEF)-like protein/PAS domain S-box-containing protein
MKSLIPIPRSKETPNDPSHDVNTCCYRQLINSIGFGVLMINAQSHLIVYVNDAAEKIMGQPKEQIIGTLCHPYMCPVEIGKCPITDLGQKIDNMERILIKPNGQRIPVIKTVVPIVLQGEKLLIESFIDISERRKMENQLKYDCLTQLYNRHHFEQEMIRLGLSNQPVGIIVCDVDGLKLINDTLGHIRGDELLNQAAVILKESCREKSLIARIGGDEFVILIPDGTGAELEATCRKIRDSLTRHNKENPYSTLSLSIGSCLRGGSQNINESFQEADNIMYRQKLHHGQSARNAIMQSLIKALEPCDFITEGHAERLGKLGVELARKINIPENRISNIRLLSKFHDIGKVGIPSYILFKKGALTESERSLIQSHCEIGYRIARSANEINHIADLILKHHEWWNGGGYPLGIGGEEIPLESRIIAIADAYDAMVNERPYRKAKTPGEAIEEMKSFSGIQFDPQLLNIFIENARVSQAETKAGI